METRERSELQLLRVSRGAHELAHMIDSWSKSPIPGVESVHIANKLLKGSLELQDSLQILSKLQNDSSRMSNMRRRVKEEVAGDRIFKEKGSKSNKIWLWKARVTVDGCSTNSMEVMKQVIRDRLCIQSLLPLQSDDENVVIKTSVSSEGKKMKVPSLIAKLMGLEEYPSGILELDEDHEVSPAGIMKSMILSPWNVEEFNLATERRSKREKITLAELILKDESFGYDYFPSNANELKRNVKRNTDQIQELNTEMSEYSQQQQQEKNVIMESVRSRESDKGKITENVSLQTDKKLKQNKKICSPKSMAVNSNCSLKREKISRENPVRRFKMAAKIDSEKFKDGRLNSSTIEKHAILRGRNISLTNVIPKQEKQKRTIFVHKGEITNDSEIIEQDRGISRLIEQSRDIFKSQQPICSQKQDIQCQSKNSAEFEAVADQLLLDNSKDASDEVKFSITQIPQTDVRRRSNSLHIGHFSEEISNSKDNLSSSSKIGEDAAAKSGLYIILENDLRCNGMIFNSIWDDGWNNGFSREEIDQIVVQMAEQIITRVLMEVAMDLAEFV